MHGNREHQGGPRGGRGFGPGGAAFGPRGPFGPGGPFGQGGPGRGGPGRGGPGRGGWNPGPQQDAPLPDAGDAGAWLTGRLPDGWFTGPLQVTVDDDEILVIGELAAPQVDGDDAARSAANEGRSSRFREDTRKERIRIARQAQERYRRTVSWGVSIGGEQYLYTHVQVPVVTTLETAERKTLDALVAAGGAGTRSAALAAALKYAFDHSAEWATATGDGEGESAAG